MIATDLEAQLKNKQTDKKLADSEFAKLLGISRSMWRHILSGKRNLGVESLSNVMTQFPDLTLEVMQYIREHK
jgi:transcriptional regulator with XRE-family HTH domain